MTTLKLDKERHVKLTLGGMKAFQEATGKSLLKGFAMADLDEGGLIALIWCCLIWEDPELTLEQVGFMLDMESIEAVLAGFSGNGDKPANPRSRPTGLRSGQSGGMTSGSAKRTSGT